MDVCVVGLGTKQVPHNNFLVISKIVIYLRSLCTKCDLYLVLV